MAEKEERILIARSTYYTLTDTDKGELFEGKIAPHCANVFTRQEAIERMAKALAFKQGKTFVNKNQWELVMMGCRFEAEEALNALLEEK